MRFGDLKMAIADRTGFPMTKIDAVLREFTSIVESETRGDESVSVPGLGTFSSVYREERNGVNPWTGEKIRIPAKRALKFKAAAALKKAVAE